MGRHGQKGRRRRIHQPCSHFLFACLAGLIGMLAGREHLAFKGNFAPVEVAECSVRLLARSIKTNFVHGFPASLCLFLRVTVEKLPTGNKEKG